MKKKTKLIDIIEIYLTACAEAEGITSPKEVAKYIKQRKEKIKPFIIEKIRNGTTQIPQT